MPDLTPEEQKYLPVPEGPTAPPGRVPVVHPDGTPGTVADGELTAAIAQGYKLAPGAEAPAGLEQLKAAGEGVLRGATLSLSDPLLSAAHVSTPEMQRARKELYPKTALGSEVGGTAASLLVPGLDEVTAPGLLAKVAKGAETAVGATSLAGKLATKAGLGAIEANLYGAGQAVDEHHLGDPRSVAEIALAHGGLNSVLGMAGGGVGGLLDEGVGLASNKLGKALEDAHETLGNIAETRTAKAMGALKSDFKRLGEEKVHEIARMALDRGHLPATVGEAFTRGKPGDFLESITKDLEETGQRVGEFPKLVDAAGHKPDFPALHQRLADLETSLDPLQRGAIAGDLKLTHEALAELEANGGGFHDLNKLKGSLQGKAKWNFNEDSFAGPLKRKLAGEFREGLDEQIGGKMGAADTLAWQHDKRIYGLLSEAQNIAERGTAQAGNNIAGRSLTDHLVGMTTAGLKGGVVGAGMGFGASVINGVMRERGAAVAARFAEDISKSPALKAVAQHFAQGLQRAPKVFGSFAPLLSAALARGPEHALATHAVLSSHFPDEYGEKAALAGFQREGPGEARHALAKAHTLATLGQVVDEHGRKLDGRIDSALQGKGVTAEHREAFGSQDFGSRRMSRDGADAYRQRAQQIRDLAGNPEALADRIALNIGATSAHAPAISAAMAQVAGTAVHYLAGQLPTPPPKTLVGRAWAPSEAEQFRFAQVLEAVEDPHSVLRRMAAGTLTPHGVEAVKAVWPAVHREMAGRLIERMQDRRGVSSRTRMMFRMLTGVDPDGSFAQPAIAANQAVHAAPTQKDGAQAPSPKPGAKSLEHLTLGKRMRTASKAADAEMVDS